MSDDPPINFDDLVKASKKSTSEGYPYQLSSKDLMRNFVFATLQVDPDYIEAAQGLGGYPARKLKFPPIPSEQSVLIAIDGSPTWLSAPTAGTYVLGAITGVLTWISTEEC
jgi:hypothetical protein